MHIELTPLDKAMKRVERVYDLMESPVAFERALPVLEDSLNGSRANAICAATQRTHACCRPISKRALSYRRRGCV